MELGVGRSHSRILKILLAIVVAIIRTCTCKLLAPLVSHTFCTVRGQGPVRVFMTSPSEDLSTGNQSLELPSHRPGLTSVKPQAATLNGPRHVPWKWHTHSAYLCIHAIICTYLSLDYSRRVDIKSPDGSTPNRTNRALSWDHVSLCRHMWTKFGTF